MRRTTKQAVTSTIPEPSTSAEVDSADDDMVNVRRRQGRAVATRRKILDAALREFATQGFDGATTRSIADRAGVPHGLVIYHYETKLAVWQAVMELALGELHDQFVRTVDQLKGSDPEVVLRAVYGDFIRMSGARPELGWLFSYEVAGQSNRLHWLLNRIRSQDLEYTLDLIRQLQAAGRFVDGDPAHLHFLFIGAATRIFGLAPEIEHHVGVSPFDKDFIERHVELCLSLFFRPSTAKPSSARVARKRSTQ
ncbi:TetR/AcrR family transcriptional regulator (plasmid) [Paraburkholderia sprentiae WSM5005]|uniref:TetR/AcrR family transcriptional regulator n=1 Tax=Paraburkholderia sprentiae WSM5005 TaxID=754502 RepID=A0A1I9YWG0_9BURK|nr:TetR/AcrR family transcriptional regulator [Paraburkholderia sprentiae]APA90556.2 TetR/AcrR family transcriptional regulator [Paraburkholderia sprentiae WSM5005]